MRGTQADSCQEQVQEAEEVGLPPADVAAAAVAQAGPDWVLPAAGQLVEAALVLAVAGQVAHVEVGHVAAAAVIAVGTPAGHGWMLPAAGHRLLAVLVLALSGLVASVAAAEASELAGTVAGGSSTAAAVVWLWPCTPCWTPPGLPRVTGAIRVP